MSTPGHLLPVRNIDINDSRTGDINLGGFSSGMLIDTTDSELNAAVLFTKYNIFYLKIVMHINST